MFEAAEVGHRTSKEEYRKREPELRHALLQAQYRLLEKGNFPVIIIVAGVDGAGKGETVNLLNEWLDPRHIHTHAFGTPSDEEAQRPVHNRSSGAAKRPAKWASPTRKPSP